MAAHWLRSLDQPVGCTCVALYGCVKLLGGGGVSAGMYTRPSTRCWHFQQKKHGLHSEVLQLIYPSTLPLSGCLQLGGHKAPRTR
jgi:hypothetical protein